MAYSRLGPGGKNKSVRPKRITGRRVNTENLRKETINKEARKHWTPLGIRYMEGKKLISALSKVIKNDIEQLKKKMQKLDTLKRNQNNYSPTKENEQKWSVSNIETGNGVNNRSNYSLKHNTKMRRFNN